MVLTNSGGVQGEAYLLKKPVVIPRKNAGVVELVKYRQVLLCDPDNPCEEEILDWKPENYVERLLGDGSTPWRIAKTISLYLEHACSKNWDPYISVETWKLLS